jgi:hypothetical protein
MRRPVESMPEPRAFTLRDWFFVVAGVAAASLMPGPFAGAWFLGFSLPLAVFLLAVQIALAPAFVVTLALLGRQLQYRRAAKPAEGLALTLVGWQIASAVPNLDTTINDLHTAAGTNLAFDWSAWRWGFAGVTLLLVLLTVVLCRALRGRGGAWPQSLGLVAAVALLFWGPLDVLNRERPWPAALLLGTPHTMQALLIRDALYCVPHGLIFGVPAVATVMSWRLRPRGWLWTEWLAAASSLVLALLILVMVAINVFENRPGAGWVWSGLVCSAWLLVVFGLSALCSIRVASGAAAKTLPP